MARELTSPNQYLVAGLIRRTIGGNALTDRAVTEEPLDVLRRADLFPVGICIVLLNGPHYEIYPIAGSLVAFAGMLLFAIIVFRHGAPQRA